jgi:hypothetical protein
MEERRKHAEKRDASAGGAIHGSTQEHSVMRRRVVSDAGGRDVRRHAASHAQEPCR